MTEGTATDNSCEQTRGEKKSQGCRILREKEDRKKTTRRGTEEVYRLEDEGEVGRARLLDFILTQ